MALMLTRLFPGWKRANEITDEHVRFRFLMKLPVPEVLSVCFVAAGSFQRCGLKRERERERD